MRKVSVVFLGLLIIFTFVAGTNDVTFTEIKSKTIVSSNGPNYTFVGNESRE